ncbi:MAG: nucleoside monophosphate kinase [Patescibacteria group bacterium]
MIVIIQGPQACGKGTQARLLAEKYGWLHLEMGKILRSISNSDNPHAAKIHDTLNSGGLVPDELVRLISWDYIKRHHEQGMIFEGYPRSLAQYEHLQDMLKKFNKRIDAVVSINIPEEESIKRMSDRRTCQRCGRVYIVGEALKCECGGELVLREDDKPQAIRRRLQIYHEQTKPVFERAKSEGIAIEIDGMHPIAEVHEKICTRLA